MSSRPAAPFSPAAAALGLLIASLAAAATAQEFQFRDGRFLETLGGVTIQRADEASSDEAVLNMPFLPGDRVWTDDSGRAEIVFAQGEILWIAERSKVDSLGRGGREQDERLGLRVFAGSFGARVRTGGPGFEFRAPGGSITTTGASAFRVDVRTGETVVSVSEGEVLVDLGGQRMTLRGGERVRYADGRVGGPGRYERASGDRFDRWCNERFAELSRVAQRQSNDRLPDELDGYGEELDRNGDWVYDEPQGYVYVPRVAYDWAPYTYGRWVYTFYGWTWVANEPWGFVTSHYGRWGYSARIGWHWMPRLGFSGAWVGWSSPVGSWNNTIGWCALGFNDRPVGSFAHGSRAFGSGGRAVARGDARSGSTGRGWSFVNQADMGRANAHRRRVELPAEEAARSVVWNPGASPDREFREARRGSEGRGRGPGPAEATGAVSRDESRAAGWDTGARIYVRPSPGDSTPELRSDPATTIPTPESRRQRTIGQDGFKAEQDKRNDRTERPDVSIEAWRSSPNPDSARPRQPERGSPAPPAGWDGTEAGSRREPTRAESNGEGSTRDPLLSRFFRSITRPNPTDQGSNPPRNDETSARTRERQPRDGSSARRSEPESRDDSAARESRPRERSRPTEARPAEPRRTDENRERARPSGGERSQPRTPPPPRSSPEGGSSDERGTRRKPHPEL